MESQKTLILNLPLKIIFGLILTLSLACAKTLSNIPEVDENLIETTLPNLIYGFKCNSIRDISHFDPSVFWVKDGESINSQKIPNGIHYIRFAGRILEGGIYDYKSNTYTSPNKEFMYFFKDDNLKVQSICDKQEFILSNYQKGEEKFNLKLREIPSKEIAIVINIADSMKDYVLAFKEIAPFIAKHIFKDEKRVYAKIALIGFSAYNIKDFGDSINEQDFIKNAESLQTQKYPTEMINYALIEGMSHFTKDNGLKKEIYLITNGNQSDMYNADKMLALTKNLNRNIVYNSQGSKENWVKIHIFSLDKNVSFLKMLAEATEGNFYEPNSIYEFKKELLKLSNDGKDVDPAEFKGIIVPSKTHKIYDPDNPDNPPLGE